MKKFNKTEKILIEGMKEAIAFSKGQKTGARVHNFTAQDISKIRRRLRISQSEFANAFGVTLATIRNWEQGRRIPEGPAKVLLAVISKYPKAVFDALRG
jgi:putative transcriptional regulator